MSNDKMWRNGDKEMKESGWEAFKRGFKKGFNKPASERLWAQVILTPLAVGLVLLVYGKE